MTARAIGDIAARVVATSSRRTFQPVRRSSYAVGEREHRIWRPIDPAEINARIQAAQIFDRSHKPPGCRNGPLGHVAIEVLEILYRMVDYKTGRLDPCIDLIRLKVRRTRRAVCEAMKRLKRHGFLSWIRRTEETGIKKGPGPRVRQISNAYCFGLPAAAVAFVRRKLGRRPGIEIEANAVITDARVARLKEMPAHDLPPDTKAALHRRAAERSSANPPGRQNPASRSKR